MIKVSTTGMAVSLKTDLRFPISGQWGHGDRIIHFEHLNAYGAQKLSSYIGNLVVNQYGIKSDTTGSELSRWKKSVKRTKKALKMAREYTDRREAQVVGEYEAAK